VTHGLAGLQRDAQARQLQHGCAKHRNTQMQGYEYSCGRKRTCFLASFFSLPLPDFLACGRPHDTKV